VRPAVNVGISVSRVGGSAQIKPMKKVSGTLKLDLAQFRDLEAFARFGSDLDKATQRQLERGRRSVQVLIQKQYSPVAVEKQVAAIYAVSRGFADTVPVDKINEYEARLIQEIDMSAPQIFEQIKAKKWTDDVQAALKEVSEKVAKSFE
ncbi:MAG: F0F1 ATP synthase subunit alpha, partial [Bacteroidota bacterium]